MIRSWYSDDVKESLKRIGNYLERGAIHSLSMIKHH